MQKTENSSFSENSVVGYTEKDFKAKVRRNITAEGFWVISP